MVFRLGREGRRSGEEIEREFGRGWVEGRLRLIDTLKVVPSAGQATLRTGKLEMLPYGAGIIYWRGKAAIPGVMSELS